MRESDWSSDVCSSDLLERYLEIEKIRFGDRLTVVMDIEDEVLSANVPTLLLQPLVENAARHGIAPRTDPGRIEISARRHNGFLQLTVQDDGPGINGNSSEFLDRGIGLTNTRARLEQLYGESYRFEMRNLSKGGLAVTISIPSDTRIQS